MTPDPDSPQEKARYLILDEHTVARNMALFRFSTAYRDRLAPMHWWRTAYGMGHLMRVLLRGDAELDTESNECLWDMFDVLQELERSVKPSDILDTILPRKGVIHDGRNGDT